MNQDKHTVRMPVRDGADFFIQNATGSANIAFTIPSREECIRKLNDTSLMSSDYSRWFLTYALTGKDPDAVEEDPVRGVERVTVRCVETSGMVRDMIIAGSKGLVLDGQYLSMDTLRERLR